MKTVGQGGGELLCEEDWKRAEGRTLEKGPERESGLPCTSPCSPELPVWVC